MPFDGSGNYVVLGSPTFPAVAGNVVKSSYFNAIINDIAQSLSNVICRDGQSFITNDLSLNGHRLTNVTDPTSNQDAATKKYVDTKVSALTYNVKDYGAAGDGTGDDTTAIQNAINAAAAHVVSGNSGGGIVYFPAGKYRITGTLSITSNFVTLRGDGKQSTYLDLANGAQDGITVNGAIRDVVIEAMSVNGHGKTAGANIKVLGNAYRCRFRNLAVENCITGFDIGESNDVYIFDTVIIPNQAGSLYGIYWHCPIDGTKRSDVLTLDTVTIEAQWSDATCIMWEGFCNTMVGSHVRLLHGKYGLRIRNPGASSVYYPQFLNVFDLEAEGFKNRAVSIEAGACFKFTASDISNLSGGAAGQGNADDYAFAVIADNGNSYTRSIQIDSTRIGLCRNAGFYCEGWDATLSGVIFVSTSFAGSGTAPAVRFSANARDCQLTAIRAEEYGGAGRASYGVQIDNGATGIQCLGIDATYCVTGAVNNLSSSDTNVILATVEPGGQGGYWTSPGNGVLQNIQNQSGGQVITKVNNRSSANNSQARYDWSTGVANAFAIAALNNGAGAPFMQESCGSAITAWYRDCDNIILRDQAGNEIVRTTTARLSMSKPIQLKVYTVATLPASPAQGDTALVTDSNTTVFNATVASGGANIVKVYYNGTAWKVG